MPLLEKQAQSKWYVAADDTLLWRVIASEQLVFHVNSGQTHLLNLIAANVLQNLQQQPLTFDQILTALAATLDYNAVADFPSYLTDVLEQLAASELIEEFDAD